MLYSSSNRHISTSTVQRNCRIAAKKPLLKDTNKKKRLAWTKKYNLLYRLVEICPLVWWVQMWDFCFQPPCLCETGERMISACVVPTVIHGGGGVMVLGCFAGNTVSNLFRIQGTLNQHGLCCILQRYAFPSGLRLVGLICFSTGQWPKTHLQAVYGLFDQEREWWMTWPPQSPDLNPIEMVWDELDRRLKEKQPTSAQHMW